MNSPDTLPKPLPPLLSLPRAFVAISFVLGLAMVFIVPPYQSPDEPAHLLRAYQISEGHFAATWQNKIAVDDFPVSIIRSCDPFVAVRYNRTTSSFAALRQAAQIPLLPEQRIKLRIEAAYYCPIDYLPQLIGIWPGRLLNLPPLILLYLGRITNLLIWVLLSFHALCLAPAFARPLFLLMLMPMSIFMSASLSPDALLQGLAFVVAALAFRAAAVRQDNIQNQFIGWPWIIEFILCAGLLSLGKAAYLPMAGLILLVPKNRFGGSRQYAVILIILALATITPIFIWSRQLPGLDIITYMEDPYVSARKQYEYLIRHPGAFIQIPIVSFRAHGMLVLRSFVGGLGWISVQLSPLFDFVYLAILLLACRPSTNEPVLANTRRTILVAGLVFAGCTEVLLIFLSIMWTAVGVLVVDGLQGRYFIPMTPAILLIAAAAWARFPKQFRSHWNELQRNLAVILIATGGCAYALIILFLHYYVSASINMY